MILRVETDSTGWAQPRCGHAHDVEHLWDDIADDDISPICPACGVSALPPEAAGEASMCENPNCDAFGELMS